MKAKIKTTQLIKSIAPDNIKIKSCFKINLFKTFILNFFLKTSLSPYTHSPYFFLNSFLFFFYHKKTFFYNNIIIFFFK